MKATKREINSILRFTEFFKLQSDNNKAVIRESVMAKCGFSRNTFYYKLKNGNFRKFEIEIIKTYNNKKRSTTTL